MLKRVCIVVILILLPLVTAQEESNLVISFVDVISKEIVSDSFVKLDVDGQVSDYYLGKEETLRIHLQKGDHTLKFLVNNPQTIGYDYFGTKEISIEDGSIQIMYLYPGGSLSGSVVDQVGTAISEAELKFECNTAMNVDYPEKTDNFGSFSLDYVPIGICQVYANFENDLGMKEIEIKPGARNFVEISLDQTIARPSKDFSIWIILLALLVFFIIIFSFRKRIKSLLRKEKEEEKEIKILKEEIIEIKSLEDLGQRGKDIFKTLRKNEKIIVEFLITQKAPVYFSKIHYKTGLSKGSLSRNIKSLEDKNIIETYKEGKVRQIKLSKWFLE